MLMENTCHPEKCARLMTIQNAAAANGSSAMIPELAPLPIPPDLLIHHP